MKKSTICIFLVISILFYVTVIVAAIKNFDINPEKYEDYEVYDYHLTALNTNPNVSKGTKFEKDGDVFSIRYRKITNQLDNRFVLAIKEGGFFKDSIYLIMQNPDNYVDVLQDWTIRKIEIYEEDGSPSQLDVLATTYDASVFTELLDFIMEIDQKEEYIPQEGFNAEYLNTNPLYVRVYFKECKDIAWESTITTYYSKQINARDILIDNGTELDGFTKIENYVLIDDYPLLYEWISTAIDGTKTRQ